MESKRYKMKDFASEYGLETDGKSCYGIYKGYRIHVKYALMGNPACLVTVVTDTDGKNENLEKFLEKNKKELKLSAYGVVGIGLMVSPQVYTNVFRQVKEILDKITAYLKKNGFPGADSCPYCGGVLDDTSVAMIESGIPFTAHSACFDMAYATAKRKEEAEQAMPANRLAGMGGALCGVLVGTAAAAILFFLWNFSALGAAVAVFLGNWLYSKFGGKNTPFKVISVALMTLVVLLAAYFVCLLVNAGGDLSKIGDLVVSDGDYRQSFILNLVFIFVFDAIGTIYAVFSLLRERKKISANMRKAS